MRKRLLVFLSVIVLYLFVYSCIKENDLAFDNLTIDDKFMYDLPIPVVDASLTLSDLLKNIDNQFIVSDSSGLLKIVYKKEFTYDFDNFKFAISDQSLQMPEITSPVPTLPIDSLKLPTQPFFVQMAMPSGYRIDSVLLNSMDFRGEIVTYIRNKVRLHFESPNLIDSLGKPLSFSRLFSGSRTIPVQSDNFQLDLSNYRLKLNNSDPNNLHQIQFNLTATVYKDSGFVLPAYDARTNMQMKLQNLDFSQAYGYLGKHSLELEPGGFDLPILNRFEMDSFEIDKAYMKLTVSNGLGFPLGFLATLTTLSHNPENPERVFEINKTVGAPNSPYEPPKDTSFDDAIESLINGSLGQGKLPYRMEYVVKAVTNPDDAQPFVHNFITQNSLIKIGVNGEVPLRLRIKRLTVSDTINFEGLPKAEGVEEFTIKANIHNAFPLDATIGLQFLDANYRVLDTISISTISAPDINPVDGHVIQPQKMQLDITLTKEQILHLVDTRHFRIVGVLNTANQSQETLVGIYEESENEGFLKVMLGCRVKASGKIISSFSELGGTK